MRVKFNKTGILANNCSSTLACSFSTEENSEFLPFEIEGKMTGLILQGTVVELQPGEFNAFICLENSLDNFVLLI